MNLILQDFEICNLDKPFFRKPGLVRVNAEVDLLSASPFSCGMNAIQGLPLETLDILRTEELNPNAKEDQACCVNLSRVFRLPSS